MDKIKLTLTRPAKKSGGDRYEAGEEGTPDFMVIYIPQKYSRKGGEVKKTITMTLE